MTMAPSWRWPWQRMTPPEPEPVRKAQDEARHQLRHDFAGHVQSLILNTEEARQRLDQMDVHLEYLRTTGKRFNDPDDVDTGGGPGGGGRVDAGDGA